MNSYICQICEVPHFSHEITQHICPHCKQVMKAKMEFIKKFFQCVMAALMLIIIIGFAVFGCSGCAMLTNPEREACKSAIQVQGDSYSMIKDYTPKNTPGKDGILERIYWNQKALKEAVEEADKK